MLIVQFDTFPTLQTQRLLLRELLPSDAEAIFKMRSNERVMQYIGKLPQKDLREAQELVETYRKAFQENEAVNWAICLLEQPDTLIGTVGFWRMDKVNHRTEIGYTLQFEHWRKGIMDETLKAVIEYCFKTLRFHSIEANTDPENEASGRILEKHGFVQEAYFRENFYFEGRFLDSRIYAKINPYP
jgi:ribosomal-protein-alanine N-acetyltransferase